MIIIIGGVAIFGLVFVVQLIGVFQGGTIFSLVVPGVLTAVFVGLLYVKTKISRTNKAKALVDAQQLIEQTKLINEGVLPVVASGIRLYENEVVHYTTRADLLESQTVGFKAGSAGMSVRIAKGVTVRSGGTKGGAIKDLVSVASGEFAATNQRLVFAGNLKSFDFKLNKVNHIENMTDGVVIHSDGKARILRMAAPGPNVQIGQAIIGKLLADNPMR